MSTNCGVIIKSTGNLYWVRDNNNQIYQCRLRGKLRIENLKTTNPIAVGDIVYVEEKEDKSYVIIDIEPRKNCIIRKATKTSKQKHIIAANLDLSIIIITILYPRVSSGFIDRLLVSAEAYDVPSVLVFNKIDLYNSQEIQKLNYYEKLYSSVGYQVISVSAKTGANLDEFKKILQGKTSLLTGHSGVGKSTLLNAIEPNLNLKTSEISKKFLKGTHTTTFVEMISLSFGANVIDTPGIKEFGLVDFEPWELGYWFPEIRKYMSQCKFYNCTHLREPGCLVIEAVEKGYVSAERYQNYANILMNVEEELPHWE